MDAHEIHRIVEAELAKGDPFNNLHGITAENVRSHLTPLRRVLVDPDDCESPPRNMWIFAEERPAEAGGYLVVYDPQEAAWGIAEETSSGEYTMVVAGDSLAEALSGM